MKANKFFGMLIIMLFLVSIISVGVAAQVQASSPGIGGFISSIFNGVVKLAEPTIKLPGDVIFPGAAGKTMNDKVAPLLLILVFAVLFTLFWSSAVKMKVFGDQRNAAKVFAIAISLLVTFFTPIAYYVEAFFTGFSNIMYGAVFVGTILLLVFAWRLFSKGFATTSKLGAADRRVRAESRRMNMDTKKMNKETGYMGDQLHNEEKGIGELEKLTKRAELQEMNIQKRLEVLLNGIKKSEAVTGPEASKYAQQLTAEATNILSLESQERQINNAIEQAMGTVEQEDVKLIHELTNEKDNVNYMIREAKRLGLGDHDEDAIKTMFARARQFALKAKKNFDELRHIAITDAKYESMITNQIKRAITDLRDNRFPDAASNIKEAIMEAKKEEETLAKVARLENLTLGGSHKEFKLIAAAMKKLQAIKAAGGAP